MRAVRRVARFHGPRELHARGRRCARGRLPAEVGRRTARDRHEHRAPAVLPVPVPGVFHRFATVAGRCRRRRRRRQRQRHGDRRREPRPRSARHVQPIVRVGPLAGDQPVRRPPIRPQGEHRDRATRRCRAGRIRGFAARPGCIAVFTNKKKKNVYNTGGIVRENCNLWKSFDIYSFFFFSKTICFK